MKEVKKITIKEFVGGYTKCASAQLQERFLKEKLVITPYVPFLTKDALAGKLVDISTYKYEDYTKEDGTAGRRKTDVVKVNSVIQYLLFCRLIIENYTNLTVETEGFFEEYDLLKSSGLLDRLMVSTETRASLIPMDEIAEVRAIIDMRVKDAFTNYSEIHNFISSQVERFGTLANITLKPILDNIEDTLENMNDKDIEKFGNKFKKMFKRIK